MKNKIFEKKFNLSMITLLMVVCVMLVLPVRVSAADVVNIPTISFSFSKNGNALSKTYTYYKKVNEKQMASVTSSNTSIATTSFQNIPCEGGFKTVVYVKFKKLGSVSITETRADTGETSSFICKAVKYKAPVNNLKFGKKDYSKKIAKSYAFEGKPFTGKVTFKAKKGWKYYRMYKFKVNELLGTGNVNQVILKKNSKVKIQKGDRLIIQFVKGDTIQSIRYTAK